MKPLPVLLAAIFMVALMSGCVTPETQPGTQTGAPDDSLGSDLQNLDTLDQDLDISELSNLENDLDNLNW